MSYTNGGRGEAVVVQSASAASAADVGKWAPGYQPVTIRAVSVLLRTVPSCAGVVSFEKRTTIDSDTGRTSFACVAIPNATAAGTVMYKSGLATTISPGQEVVVKVTDATGGGTQTIDAVVSYEAGAEVPANVTTMTASA